MLKILQENKKFQGLGWVRNRIWVLERCRRRFFFLKTKYIFWCWSVAAGAFFLKKLLFSAGALPQAPFFL